MKGLKLDSSFINYLPADPVEANFRRLVKQAAYSYVMPLHQDQAKVIHVSDTLAIELGLSESDWNSSQFSDIVTGRKSIGDTTPYAMNYGGHQFGHWAGQLGDGRAINLFEMLHNGGRYTWQLKGAGPTPYSRSADGFAVLRSSIREHLCSEAMHHLGIATTRSLSLALSGEDVLRDMMYDGNAAYEKGAIVCRVAPSFLRFGNYQIFAARQEHDVLKDLIDYTIRYFYPEIKEDHEDRYLLFFESVVDRTMDMIVDWMRVGFVHGVMNTDNMSILGLTIDYGPYGWIDHYDLDWTPNTTDAQNRRYRYGNQANIALWNLTMLANALFPIIDDKKGIEEILLKHQQLYWEKYINMMGRKLGIAGHYTLPDIIKKVELCLQMAETDYTIFFRELSKVSKEMRKEDAFDKVKIAFYNEVEITNEIREQWYDFFDEYLKVIVDMDEDHEQRRSSMNCVNPKYIFRNYIAQEVIDKAEKGDYTLINEFYQVLQHPYDDKLEYEKWYQKRPEYARNKIGCSMLSCSS